MIILRTSKMPLSPVSFTSPVRHERRRGDVVEVCVVGSSIKELFTVVWVDDPFMFRVSPSTRWERFKHHLRAAGRSYGRFSAAATLRWFGV